MANGLILSSLNKSFGKITTALLESDLLFKLLKDEADNAQDESKTIEHDDKLILINQNDKINRRLIWKPYLREQVIDDTRTELRIYVMNMKPDNRYYGKVIYGFDILVHNDLWDMKDGDQRPLLIAQEIYKFLNNKEIKDIGKLEATSNDDMTIREFTTGYSGYTITLTTCTG